ncbi:MAG: GNAT family N-acetyltransferase [Planctomycetota bacterium]|jgi:ribosomal protein S18 acetylase RimI-like enzyme
MATESPVTIRLARRHDASPLVELRVQFLSEIGRLEPRYELLPDVRHRSEVTLPVWIEQEERVLLVAEAAGTEEKPPTLVGYATGVVTVWPPIFVHQHVGEVAEVYVLPEARGHGIGARLVQQLSEALRRQGADVLRAPVPVGSEEALERFRGLGYRKLQYVMEKSLEED